MHSRATSVRSKCGRTFDPQFRQKRTHDALPHPATLVTIQYRIQYKLYTLMHNIRSRRAPRYLSDIVQPTSARTTRSGLRCSSAQTTSYVAPRLHTTFGERAFSFSGLAIWNSLPADLRFISDNADFKTQLKTHFFQLAFNIQ